MHYKKNSGRGQQIPPPLKAAPLTGKDMLPEFDEIMNLVPLENNHGLLSFVSTDTEENRIRLTYYFDSSTGVLYASVKFGILAQGPPRHVHGGATGAVFDELMGVTCWMNDQPVMTAQLTIRYLKPLPLETPVLFKASIKSIDGAKIVVRASVKDGEGVYYSEAKGLFIKQDTRRFQQMGGLSENEPEVSDY